MMLKKIYKKTNRFNKIEKISYKNRLHTEQENTTKHINTNCEGEEGGRKIEENWEINYLNWMERGSNICTLDTHMRKGDCQHPLSTNEETFTRKTTLHPHQINSYFDPGESVLISP